MTEKANVKKFLGNGIQSSLDLVWIQSGSSVDLVWIQCGSTLDFVWIQSGLSPDSVSIQSGSSLYLVWIYSGSSLELIQIQSGCSLDLVWMQSSLYPIKVSLHKFEKFLHTQEAEDVDRIAREQIHKMFDPLDPAVLEELFAACRQNGIQVSPRF